MDKDTTVRVTRNSMLMPKPSEVCGNPATPDRETARSGCISSRQQTGSLKPSTPVVDASSILLIY
jgi:hypothetical protein